MHKTFSPCELGCELDGTAREFGDHENIGERLRRHPGFTRGGGIFSGMNGGFEAAGLIRKRTTEWNEDSQKRVEVVRWNDSSGETWPLLKESHDFNFEQSSSRIGSEAMNGEDRSNQESFGFLLHCLDKPTHLLLEAWMQENKNELRWRIRTSKKDNYAETNNGIEITCASCKITEKINWVNLKEKIEKLRTSKKPNSSFFLETPWRKIP